MGFSAGLPLISYSYKRKKKQARITRPALSALGTAVVIRNEQLLPADVYTHVYT